MTIDSIGIITILTIKLTQSITQKRVTKSIWDRKTINLKVSSLKIHHLQFLTHTHIKLKASTKTTQTANEDKTPFPSTTQTNQTITTPTL